jgi:hypothetical protein
VDAGPAAPAAPPLLAAPTLRLRIADLVLAIESTDARLSLGADDVTGRFLVKAGEPDAVVRARLGSLGPDPAERLFDAGTWRLFRVAGGFAFRLWSSSAGTGACAELATSADFTEAEVTLDPNWVGGASPVYPLQFPLDELLVQGLLARGRGVELHACGVVAPSGAGLLFVGASGAGKTTTARLWARAGAAVISDDRVIVRRGRDGLVLHGTPWHGEERYAEPVAAPLAAVFLLRHADTNDLASLSAAEAAARLFACAFPPFYDAAGLDFTIGFLGALAGQVRCMGLGFVPDETAVAFVSEAIRP